MSAFIIVIFALWFYPPIAYVVISATADQPGTRQLILWTSFILSGLAIAGLITGISTTSSLIDWFMLMSIYGTVSLLIWILRTERGKKGHYLAGIAQLSIFGAGYVFSTAGFTAIGFMVAAHVPNDVRNVGDGLIYKEVPYGNAVSDFRLKRVELTRTSSALPLIEWPIVRKEYDASDELMAPPFGIYYNQQRQQLCLSASHLSDETKRLESWSDTLDLGK
ncbi:hypothetical protein J2I47_00780 [Fibrella sp. HMF5335]|uniref:Uncharacterized protein n=1 Tax=Fibrella rubiginis TaxID=2817060 RepID=A0A939GD67_9BACT|nr:hypothetical protein [Fibrella rubiginis]MBO0935069.1 hypothetical protein [Fibrella rubiginis]